MGIYDRDYIREPSPGGPNRSGFYGSANPWSVNTWLIVINVAVFLLNAIITVPGGMRNVLVGTDPFGNDVYQQVAVPPSHPIDMYGYFSVVTAVAHAQVWRFLTFQFLHASFNHIFANMLGLFFFGPLIETYLGRRKYLAFYLLCGVAGPFAYMLLWAMHLLHDGPATPLVGASAGIFGVLIAAAMVAPNAEVLVFGIIPMKMRTFAWGLLGLAVYAILFSGDNAGGQAAHLGGAAVGFLLIREPQLLRWADWGGRRVTRMRYRP